LKIRFEPRRVRDLEPDSSPKTFQTSPVMASSPDSRDSYPHPAITGLFIAKGALLPDELASILSGMTGKGWFVGERSNNQVMIFGAIPAFLDRVQEIGKELLVPGLRGREPVFNQGICNRYFPGQGLKQHVDLTRFENGIIVASITGTCSFEFMKMGGSEVIPVFLEPGDVISLNGEARWNWTHGIPERTVDVVDGKEIARTERISVTLRRMEPDE